MGTAISFVPSVHPTSAELRLQRAEGIIRRHVEREDEIKRLGENGGFPPFGSDEYDKLLAQRESIHVDAKAFLEGKQ